MPGPILILRSMQRHHNNKLNRPRHQRGAALIESLVAAFILGLGLLGMAGMQVKTMKSTRSSEFRSQAVMLSYYMLDVLRADRASALAGTYNTDTSPDLPLEKVCNSGAITGAALPDNAKKAWVDSLRKNLGDSDTTCGAIYCTVTGICTIQITWDDALAGGLGEQVFSTGTKL